MSKDAIEMPRSARRFVEVLGPDLACKVFLAYGGSVVYLADNPQARGQLSKILTPEQIRDLRTKVVRNDLWVRVPTAKPFVAMHMRSKGIAVAEIARTLHVADWTVRRWTARDLSWSPEPASEPDLFS